MIDNKSDYMKFIPEIFHEPLKEKEVPLIERYLKIFEIILDKNEEGELNGKKGIGEVLDIIPDAFHPRFPFLCDRSKKPYWPYIQYDEKKAFKSYFRPGMEDDEFVDEFLDEFLGWLASWVALVLKEDWELEKKREVIARIIPIYRMRGTEKGLKEFLKIYVTGEVDIESNMGFKVGESKVGVDTLVGVGIKPNFFIVRTKITKTDRIEQIRFLDNLKTVLDTEKPAHTTYLLKVSVPTLEIGNRDGSKVGENTLIGGTFTEIRT